jgi:hypothetical protein
MLGDNGQVRAVMTLAAWGVDAGHGACNSVSSPAFDPAQDRNLLHASAGVSRASALAWHSAAPKRSMECATRQGCELQLSTNPFERMRRRGGTGVFRAL